MQLTRPWQALRVWVMVSVLVGLVAPAWAQSPRQETLQSNAAATGNGTQASTLGYSLAAVQIVGTGFTGTLTFEASVDGATYTAVMCTSMADTATTSTTATGDGTWFCPIAGAQKFRARLSSFSAGAVTVKATLMPQVSRPAPAASTGGGGTVTSITGGTCLSGGTISSSGTLSVTADCIGPTQIDETANYTWSGTDRFTGTFSVPHSTSLPGTCTVGDAYMDTDATSGARWYLCESSNTWAAQGGAGTVTGSGTTGTIPVWASATALGNSGLTDNGSVLTVNRGYRGKVAAKSADYTLTTADYQIDCTAGSGGITLTLPSASGLTGQHYLVYKVDTDVGACTVSPNGSDLLNGVNGAVTSLTTAYAGLAMTQVSSTAWTVTSLGPLTIGDTISASTDASVLTVGTGGVLAQVTPGTDGKVFTMVSGVPAWADAAGGVAIGDTVTSGTAGSVLYLGTSGVLAQDNANLFWDATNHAFRVGPTAAASLYADEGTVRVVGNNFPALDVIAGGDGGGALRFFLSDGTPGSPTALSGAGSALGSLLFYGRGSASNGQVAALIVESDGAALATGLPGRMTVRTMASDGSAYDRLLITSQGTTSVDGTACTANGSTHCLAGQVEVQDTLYQHLSSSNPATGNHYGLRAVQSYDFTGASASQSPQNFVSLTATGTDSGSSKTFQVLSTYGEWDLTGGAITNLYNMFNYLSIGTGAAATNAYNLFLSGDNSGTVGTRYGMYIDSPGASTNYYGIYVQNSAGGSTLKYGVYLEDQTSTGISLYNAGKSTFVKSVLTPIPATEAITAGATITADSCGGLKRLSSASSLTTSTTNTITAPAAGNAGCHMTMCNTNASNTITLDSNSNIQLTGGADLVLGAGCCVDVFSTGASGVWKQTSAQLCSS